MTHNRILITSHNYTPCTSTSEFAVLPKIVLVLWKTNVCWSRYRKRWSSMRLSISKKIQISDHLQFPHPSRSRHVHVNLHPHHLTRLLGIGDPLWCRTIYYHLVPQVNHSRRYWYDPTSPTRPVFSVPVVRIITKHIQHIASSEIKDFPHTFWAFDGLYCVAGWNNCETSGRESVSLSAWPTTSSSTSSLALVSKHLHPNKSCVWQGVPVWSSNNRFNSSEVKVFPRSRTSRLTPASLMRSVARL